MLDLKCWLHCLKIAQYPKCVCSWEKLIPLCKPIKALSFIINVASWFSGSGLKKIDSSKQINYKNLV